MGIGKVGGNHHGGRGKRIDGKDRATVEEPGGIWKSVCLHRCVGRSTNVPALTSYCCTWGKEVQTAAIPRRCVLLCGELETLNTWYGCVQCL
jgi:hypothetical protein